MTVKSGSQSSIYYQGSEIRGRGWTLNITRETRDITCSNRIRRKYRVGRRTTTGQVQLFYDPDDTAAIDMLNAVDTTEQTPTTLALYLDNTGTPLSVEALFTRRSIAAQVGSAHAVTLGFQATGPVTGGF